MRKSLLFVAAVAVVVVAASSTYPTSHGLRHTSIPGYQAQLYGNPHSALRPPSLRLGVNSDTREYQPYENQRYNGVFTNPWVRSSRVHGQVVFPPKKTTGKCSHIPLLLCRRLIWKQHQSRIPLPTFPHVYPTVGYPRYPWQDSDESTSSDETFWQDDNDDDSIFSDSNESDSHEDNDRNIFQRFPVKESFWPTLPFPKIPNVHKLPDDYDNATHTVHLFNGTRVVVNTTTNKNSDDDSTSFFHTKVISIGPHFEPPIAQVPKKEEEEVTTVEQAVKEKPKLAPEDEEQYPTQIPVEEEEATKTEPPIIIYDVPNEVVVGEVNNGDSRLTRRISRRTRAQQSASYVKKAAGGARKGKGKGGKPAPKDLSRDTLVNKLDKDIKGAKPTEEDAEVIL